MDPLFPEIPEDLKGLSDEEVQQLLDDHISAAALIDADDAEFLKDMSGDDVIAQYTAGVEQIQKLRAEHSEREDAHAEYQAKKAELAAQINPAEETEDEGDEDDGGKETEEAPVEVVAEAEETEEAVEETEQEKVLVTASISPPRYSRTPPAPVAERQPVPIAQEPGTSLVAAGGYKGDYPQDLDPDSLAHLMRDAATDLGPLNKIDAPGKYVTETEGFGHWEIWADGSKTRKGGFGQINWDGPKTKVAKAEYDFPEERTLNGNDDFEKIRAVLPETVEFAGRSGGHGGEALVASGGLCAPLTPIYSMPNFATEAEPVWDSLPVFRAARGGVNVPEATYIANITTAISSISEANDALGGTFAEKSCQDLTCPDYTETAVNIFAHCREYGNLNARAWPEKIAHENALTMAALSRVSEGFMLDRIKALSVNVTNGAETLGALIYLVDAIVKAAFGIRGRLRMPREARFRALLPAWVPDMLVLDNIQTQFDRFRSKEELVAYLRSVGIDPVFYLDTPSTGTTQLPDSAQTAAAIDSLPDNVQWAIFPEGAFIGIDMGVLELGIVRDSVLNATNDFQVFGERFRNLARIAPAQAAYWVTSDLCASGQFPPAGTARTCD
jgi:hypothetical protein